MQQGIRSCDRRLWVPRRHDTASILTPQPDGGATRRNQGGLDSGTTGSMGGAVMEPREAGALAEVASTASRFIRESNLSGTLASEARRDVTRSVFLHVPLNRVSQAARELRASVERARASALTGALTVCCFCSAAGPARHVNRRRRYRPAPMLLLTMGLGPVRRADFKISQAVP